MLAVADNACAHESNRRSFSLIPNGHRKTASQGRAPRRGCQTRLHRATLRAVRRGPETSLAPPAGVQDASCTIRRRFAIRGVDVSGGRDREFGAASGLCWEGGEPFYGTRAGPGWYQGTARVARGCQVPFSVLRLLIQAAPNCNQSHPKATLMRHIKATSMRVDSQAVATPKPP